MCHAEPPAQLGWSQACIFVVPTPIIKPEAKIFGDVDGVTGYPLKGVRPFKSVASFDVLTWTSDTHFRP